MRAGSAGTLEIQLIADVAKLQHDMRAMERAVTTSNDNIVRTTNKGGGAFGNFSKSVSGAAEKSKLAGYQMQNLSYQINDVIVGLTSGQKPMTVFTQQGSQIAQIMAQAGVGVGGLVKQVASAGAAFVVANPLLLAAGAAAAVLAAGVGLVTAEINKNSDVTVTWQDTLLGAFDVVKAGVSEKVTAAFDAMGLDVGEVWDWIVQATKTTANVIIGVMSVVPRTISATYDKIGPAIGDAFYSAANLAIEALNELAKASTVPLNFIIDSLNSAFGTKIKNVMIHGLNDIENPYKGGMAKLASAGAKSLTDTFTTDYIGGLAGALAEAAENRARSHDAAEKAGKDLGKVAGSAAGKEAAKQLQMSFAEAFKDIADYAKQISAAMGEMQGVDKRLNDLAQEEKLLGLTGKAREDMLRQLQRQAELDEVQIKLTNAKRAENGALADVYQDIIDKLHEVYAAEDKIDQFNEGLARGAAEAAHLNDQFSDMIGLLTRIGGAGGVLGSVLAIMSGKFNDIAGGPVGDVLAYALNTQTGWMKNDKGEDIPRLLGDELRNVFGSNGIFAETLMQTLGNAGLGYAAGAAITGNRSTGSAVGGTIGGILGGGLATSYAGVALQAAISNAIGGTLGAALGSAVPVVGTILGGLAGSLIGGLFSGSKKGVVGIGGSGSNLSVYGTKHSSAQQTAAATDAANGVIGSLNQLAEALGGTVNAARASVTVGMKNDSWRVDTLGQGRTDLKAGVLDFGKDQAAAVKAVMQDLLKDGVIDGIRASTMRLLQTGGDLDAALQKALAFEGVFKELKATSSPFADQLRAMSDQFAQLTTIFQQAGASADEYAQLQQLIALKQRALVDQASSAYRSNFYSDAQNVAYAKQTISDTLSPFGKGNVQSVAAYTRLVDATDALASPELYGALMDLADEFAVIKDAAEAAKQAKAAEAAQKQAQREQELAYARNAVAQAYSRESGALEQTVDRLARLSESLRDLRSSIYDGDKAATSYATQLARLQQVGGLAAMGDEGAAGQLGGVVRDYLSAAKASSATLADYQMAQAKAARYVDSAIGAADAGQSVAQQQLDQLKSSAISLGVIEDHVVTMAEAAQELNRLLGGGTSSSGGGGSGSGGNVHAQAQAQAQVDRLARRIDQTQRMLDSSKSDLAIARLTEKLEGLEAAMVAATLAQTKSASVLDYADRGNSIAVRIVADDTV